MGAKDKEKSLLEISVELLSSKHKPQQIMQIAKESMEIKGLKTAQAQEMLPQFLADFMESGYFVYCGDGTWDLKERQSTAVLDKDGSDYEVYANEDEDVRDNELKDDTYDDYTDNRTSSNDEDEDEEDEEDDISKMLTEDEDGNYTSDVFGDEEEDDIEEAEVDEDDDF
jgi:DNA-directed RNA polymerase delta subunit